MPIVGEIRAFAFHPQSGIMPEVYRAGWIPCDGRAVTYKRYPKLGDALLATWGSEDLSVNFCVPNLNGTFLRGAQWSNRPTKDPDARRKVPRPDLSLPGFPGESAGVGSLQDHCLASHGHDAHMEIGAEPRDGKAQSREAAGSHGAHGTYYTSNSLVQSTGGKETRPVNHAVLYMIWGGDSISPQEAEEMARVYRRDQLEDDVDEPPRQG